MRTQTHVKHYCSPFVQPENDGAYFPGSTMMGLFPLFINLLSIFHNDVRGKRGYPMILFQLKSSFTTRQKALTDKTGINNNIPKRRTLTIREGL